MVQEDKETVKIVLEVENEINETVEIYLEAVKTGNSGGFDRAFYPDSVVINAGEDDPAKAVIPIHDFAARMKKSHDSGTPVEEIPLSITVNHVANVANVRLDFELRIGDKKLYGTDYLNMVRRGGMWRISQKIYDITHT